MVFDLPLLRKMCIAPIPYFHKFGEVVENKSGIYIYKDNGADVLAVAHLDTVFDDTFLGIAGKKGKKKERRHEMFQARQSEKGGLIVQSPNLDDRLGAYVILDLLPKLGIKVDILLTEGEEIGASTAQHFAPPQDKKYNWAFSFDRMGTDVVMYQYDDTETRKLLKEYKFRVGNGSFSDIAFLELGCKAFNFGVGYEGQHTRSCHAFLSDTKRMVSKFAKFFSENKDNMLAHDHSADRKYSIAVSYYNPMYYDYRQDWDENGGPYIEGHTRHDLNHGTGFQYPALPPSTTDLKQPTNRTSSYWQAFLTWPEKDCLAVLLAAEAVGVLLEDLERGEKLGWFDMEIGLLLDNNMDAVHQMNVNKSNPEIFDEAYQYKQLYTEMLAHTVSAEDLDPDSLRVYTWMQDHVRFPAK